jgi:hypothetical protein
MDKFSIINGKYKYNIKLSKNRNLCCNYPKETVKPRFRGMYGVYYDYSEKDFRTITYPDENILTFIDADDLIENDLINIRNEWPNWETIDVVFIG